jgi:hypothetical protein
MFSFFDQPWTLFIAAIVSLYVVFRLRSIFPQKCHWWQWLIPVFIAVAAFGFDFLVRTDLEKINAVIDNGIRAIEEENPGIIEAIVSADYQDSYHSNKEHLMSHCRSEMGRDPVEENKKVNALMEISTTEAEVTLIAMVKFDKDSYVTRNYKQSFLVKAQLYLTKQQDKRWLISRAELLELDRQQVNWEQIR